MTGQLRFEDLPLREQKAARTRMALLSALLEGFETRTLEEITTRELAAKAGVSEMTFFNYFPSKQHLLTYFIQIWSLEVAAVSRRIEKNARSALSAIEAIFDYTGRELTNQPNTMLEIISHQARMPIFQKIEPVDRAVRLLHLPDTEDIFDLPDTGLESVLPPLLEQAIEQGELPPTTSVEQVLLALTSVFFTVPLIFARRQPEAICPMYRAQLALVWAGAKNLGE